MKRIAVALLASAWIGAGSAQAAGDTAYIDVQEVFRRFYKTELAQDQMRQQADDIKLERDALEDEMKGLQEEVEQLRKDARDETLSEAVRAGKRDQLEEKLVEMQKKESEMTEFEKLRREQMEQQNSRMTRKLFDEIHDAVIKYGRAEGFSAIIDRSSKSQVGTQNVLYVAPEVDITADVLAILNEGHEPQEDSTPDAVVEE